MSADCNQKSAILDSSASVCRKFAIIYWFLLSSRLCNLQREKIGVLSFPSWRAGDPSCHHYSLECPSGKMKKCSHIPITFLLVWGTAGIGQVLCQPGGESQTSFWPDLGPMPWDGLTGEDEPQPQPGIAITAHQIFSTLSLDSIVGRIFAWKAWSRSNYLNNL